MSGLVVAFDGGGASGSGPGYTPGGRREYVPVGLRSHPCDRTPPSAQPGPELDTDG